DCNRASHDQQSYTDSTAVLSARPPGAQLASHPTANVATDPINTYHCQETPVRSLTQSISAAPATTPAKAAACPTRFVKVPRKNTQRMTRLVNEAMPSTSSTTRPKSLIPTSATVICATPQTAVSRRETFK